MLARDSALSPLAFTQLLAAERLFTTTVIHPQVVQGLIKVVSVSLATLNQQIDHAYIVKNQLAPMLELEMHLSGDKVCEL